MSTEEPFRGGMLRALEIDPSISRKKMIAALESRARYLESVENKLGFHKKELAALHWALDLCRIDKILSVARRARAEPDQQPATEEPVPL